MTRAGEEGCCNVMGLRVTVHGPQDAEPHRRREQVAREAVEVCLLHSSHRQRPDPSHPPDETRQRGGGNGAGGGHEAGDEAEDGGVVGVDGADALAGGGPLRSGLAQHPLQLRHRLARPAPAVGADNRRRKSRAGGGKMHGAMESGAPSSSAGMSARRASATRSSAAPCSVEARAAVAFPLSSACCCRSISAQPRSPSAAEGSRAAAER